MNASEDEEPDFRPRRVDEDALSESAVVVPLFEFETGVEGLLLTKRASHLPQHAGEVSFPGGRREPGDDDLLDTALREIEEEVGVPRELVEVDCCIDDVDTTTGFVIRPYLGEIPFPFDFEIQQEEVAEIILAPLEELADPGIHEIRSYGGRDLHYFYFDGYTIWGATAEILARYLRDTYGWSPEP